MLDGAATPVTIHVYGELATTQAFDRRWFSEADFALEGSFSHIDAVHDYSHDEQNGKLNDEDDDGVVGHADEVCVEASVWSRVILRRVRGMWRRRSLLR